MQSNNNILIAQGGGPTNVINQSLVGIINGEKNKKSNIIGAINGVRGIINNNFINLLSIIPLTPLIAPIMFEFLLFSPFIIPTNDWLITFVGPPHWAISILLLLCIQFYDSS